MAEAIHKLNKFKITISASKKEPTYGQISFTYQDLGKFNSLRHYTGEYGFVVPVRATKRRKILKGEKLLKFTQIK